MSSIEEPNDAKTEEKPAESSASAEAPADKPKLPVWALWCTTIGLTGVLCVAAAELALRVIPGEWSSAFFHVYDPKVGTWHFPSYEGDWIRSDVRVEGVHMNRWGMRDREREIEKTPGVVRMAVLGDSYPEGLQVADDATFTRRAEDILVGKAEVLNFGVGGYGTASALVAYREKVRPFKPDIVVLAYLSGNDTRNNSMELESLYNGGGRREMPFPVRAANGSWTLDPVPPRPKSLNPVVLFFKRHFTLYRFAWLMKQRVPERLAAMRGSKVVVTGDATSTEESANVRLTRLSMPPSEPVFAEAWEGTEWLIAELKREVEADGAKLVLVALPGAPHIEPDSRAALEKEYGAPLPAEFDVDYPEKRLAAYAKDIDLAFLDLVPAFRRERDARKLAPPYFSFATDGHWNADGHALAADELARYLISNGYVEKP